MEKGRKTTANVNKDKIPGTQMDEQCVPEFIKGSFSA
jgi:hypothetical protein